MPRHRFHMLGLSHTVSVRDSTACASTQKVVRLCHPLKRRGHTVIHDGHQGSVANGDELVSTVTRSDVAAAAAGHVAPLRVSGSDPALHACPDLPGVRNDGNDGWCDAVIPEVLDLVDFDRTDPTDGHRSWLGRVRSGKGVHVAVQVAGPLGPQ